jgi:4-hydroxybenzoate polyprenyltransferase
LVELTLELIRRKPSNVFSLPFWLLGGKSFLKQTLAASVTLDVATLPYNPSVLATIRREKEVGRRIYLVTASPRAVAQAVADHLGVFDGVMATENGVNLSAGRKRDRLVAEFGMRAFDYAGNAWADLPIWQSARKAILVEPHAGIRWAAAKSATVENVIDDRPSRLRALAKTIRVHQWLKNVLVFAPYIASHRFADVGVFLNSVLAFFGLSFCASAIYVINDLLDLPADRQHPKKRHRPLASGRVPLVWGIALVPVLFGLAAAIATVLPPSFGAALAAYGISSVAYSMWLKKHEMFDVTVLAGLWTLRLIIGGAATGIVVSFWLMAFAMFLFMSLALSKRCAELIAVRQLSHQRALGRDYRVDDLVILAAMGVSAGCMAVLVMAFYINNPTVGVLYKDAEVIWLLCPLLLYWIGRVWLKTWRGEMNEDPVLFALTDRASRLLLATAAIVLLIAQ